MKDGIIFLQRKDEFLGALEGTGATSHEHKTLNLFAGILYTLN